MWHLFLSHGLGEKADLSSNQAGSNKSRVQVVTTPRAVILFVMPGEQMYNLLCNGIEPGITPQPCLIDTTRGITILCY